MEAARADGGGWIDPAAFAKTIAAIPEEQLDEGMRSPNRAMILDAIFAGFADHFRPDRARSLSAVLDWKILDRPEGGYDHYRVTIAGGSCTVTRDPGKGSPRVTFRVRPVDFLKLVTGNVSGPALFLRGRLRIKGDLLFAARVQELFGIPRAG